MVETAAEQLTHPKLGNPQEWGYIPPVASQVEDLKTDKYDNTLGVLENARISTVPIPTEKGNLVLMRTVRYDVPQSDELNVKRNRAVIIGVGGGGSGALEGIGWIRRTADALAKISPAESALNVTSIVTVSHPQGAARQQDTINEENLKGSAELILKTIIANEPDGKPLENDQPRILDADTIIVWGASAGGGVAIELARLLEQAGKKYTLVLVDPAATSSHPNLMKEVTLGNVFALLNYFKFLSQKEADLSKELPPNQKKYAQHKLQLLKSVFKEVLVSMTTPEGAPDSLLGLLKEMAYKGKARLDEIARRHGLEMSEGGIMQDILPIMKDSTEEARSTLRGDVLLVSPVFSPTVNLLIARKGFTKPMLTAMWGYYETHRVGYIVDLFKALKKQEPHATREELLDLANDLLRQEFIDTLYLGIATELFPHAKLQVMAEPSGLHSGISRTDAINRIVSNVVFYHI